MDSIDRIKEIGVLVDDETHSDGIIISKVFIRSELINEFLAILETNEAMERS